MQLSGIKEIRLLLAIHQYDIHKWAEHFKAVFLEACFYKVICIGNGVLNITNRCCRDMLDWCVCYLPVPALQMYIPQNLFMFVFALTGCTHILYLKTEMTIHLFNKQDAIVFVVCQPFS